MRAKAVSRLNRYLVIINPPARKDLTQEELLASEHGGGSIGGPNDLESINMTRNVAMMCSKVTMPA